MQCMYLSFRLKVCLQKFLSFTQLCFYFAMITASKTDAKSISLLADYTTNLQDSHRKLIQIWMYSKIFNWLQNYSRFFYLKNLKKSFFNNFFPNPSWFLLSRTLEVQVWIIVIECLSTAVVGSWAAYLVFFIKWKWM